MEKIDFSKYKDVPTIVRILFGEFAIDMNSHPLWKIPNKIAVIVAPTGSSFKKEQNPYQPYTVDEIIKESIESVEEGACSVHVHVRDKYGVVSGDRELTKRVVNTLRDRFGGSIHIDGEALYGKTFEQTMEPITSDFYESAAVSCIATYIGDAMNYCSAQLCKAQVEVIQAYGKKPLLAVHNPGDIDNTYRWLIQPGIVKPPFCWIIGVGLPGTAPIRDPLSMAETLLYMIRRIKDADKAEHPIINVMTCGRASSYLTTLAILLGHNVRVGKEDTINIVPHSSDVLVSNKDMVKRTVTIARLLGREPMTGPEYREALGMKPFK